ncbi:DUF4097 family beta strand repeat-containing protein [Lactococcus formosensis]|uniref:DUF4097 family beta strand repeat-containing protein n=1 Tax=Lactococcus formosensis TaxID=1281486 RepID=UPI0022E19C24|nr:DUF4097 domain-containing protein [Lactococcus formosensis]
MNKKDRIMDLMRRGIITEDEALELLDKSNPMAEEGQSENKEKFNYTDTEGFVNHDVDFMDSFKGIMDQIVSKGKVVFKDASKAIDDNIDFSKGFPKVKSTVKTVEKDIEGDFHSVNLDIKAGKIAVHPGDNAHVKAEYRIYGAVDQEKIDEYLAEKTKLEVNDGVLEITTSDSLRTAVNLELYLPEKVYETFDFKFAHGDIKVEKVAVDNLEIDQVNGEVELVETTNKDINVTIKNGEIKVLDGSTNVLNLNSVNGNIRVTSAFEDGNVNLVNGNILLTQNQDTPRKLMVKNVNGDVKLSVPEYLGLVGHVRTVFGGYKTRLNLDNPFEASRNGAAVVRTGPDTLTFELETKSGTIWLKDID